MAAVTRNPRDGRWLARWRDPGGVQCEKAFDRKVDAQRWLDQMQAQAHRGPYIDSRAASIRVADVVEPWAAGLSHLKESTAARYRNIVTVHVLPRFGTWRLDQLKHPDIQKWVRDLSRKGLAPGTVRQCHRVLSLALDTAVEDDRIAANPARRVTLPEPRRAEASFLDAEEVARMVRAAGVNGPSVAVLALCGLRFGELAALRVRDVDLDRRRLTVAGSVTEVAGRLVWSDPKTGRTRCVPFPASSAPMIAELARGRGRGKDEQLSTAPEGGPLRLGNWRYRVFDRAARAVGRDDISAHDLRHTAASLAVQAGANVKAVQPMLGHASAAMTLDVCAGLFEDDLGDVAAALDAIMSPTSTSMLDDGPLQRGVSADPALTHPV